PIWHNHLSSCACPTRKWSTTATTSEHPGRSGTRHRCVLLPAYWHCDWPRRAQSGGYSTLLPGAHAKAQWSALVGCALGYADNNARRSGLLPTPIHFRPSHRPRRSSCPVQNCRPWQARHILSLSRVQSWHDRVWAGRFPMDRSDRRCRAPPFPTRPLSVTVCRPTDNRQPHHTNPLLELASQHFYGLVVLPAIRMGVRGLRTSRTSHTVPR